jgi:hypothetical protein
MSNPQATEYFTPQGDKVDSNKCVQVDHVEDVFTIAVSSISGLAVEQIVERLQGGSGDWEVTFNRHPRRKVVCSDWLRQ